MKSEQKKSTGHSILRYKVRLYDRHFPWLVLTRELYVKVVAHFFAVLEQEKELLELSNFHLLREMEVKCIGTKEMKAAGIAPAYPLEGFPKIPLYFRRSAINAAVDLARKKAGTIAPHMVLYKGMYENFTDRTIDLKLFNGEKWVWVTYPFTGRAFPKEAERLSPLLVVNKKEAWLEVPLSFLVEDVRTVKERMQTEERICALSFPDSDTQAVAVILARNGTELAHCFFRGGKARNDKRRQLLTRIYRSEKSRGHRERGREHIKGAVLTKQVSGKENAKRYEELGNLNKHYAHSISHDILKFCLEQEIKVIVVPNYENGIDFRNKQYLKTDAYRWLGRSIIKNLKYKAFQKGIIVTSVRPYHISDCCSECGAKIRKYNEGHTAGLNYYGGKLFLCPNGHRGNTARNTANNVGKQFLSYYPAEYEVTKEQEH